MTPQLFPSPVSSICLDPFSPWLRRQVQLMMLVSAMILMLDDQNWFLSSGNYGNSIIANHLDPGATGSGSSLSRRPLRPSGTHQCVASAAGLVPMWWFDCILEEGSLQGRWYRGYFGEQNIIHVRCTVLWNLPACNSNLLQTNVWWHSFPNAIWNGNSCSSTVIYSYIQSIF